MDNSNGKDTSFKPECNRDQDELLEKNLQHVSGEYTSKSIKVCKVCQRRIAVFGMLICASCFREQNPF